ncbi:MAG: transketolase C-terminal domain-containing protein [Candidatus Paceibacterota bacterium]|jgi:hypothetical protein
MLSENLFKKEEEKASQVENTLLSLLNLNKDDNKIFEVDNLNITREKSKHIFPVDNSIEISAIVSAEESKNVFLINSGADRVLQNLNTSLADNLIKIYRGLLKVVSRFSDNKNKDINLSVLNMIQKDSKDKYHDVSLMRNLGQVNIFVPADANEAEYLIRVSEKKFFKNNQKQFSYFRLVNDFSPKIYSDNYFINNQNDTLREYTGMPEIVHISSNLDSAFRVGIIASGPILYNALVAAKDLEEKNYNVTVLNMSLISSNSEYINQKIKSFIANFANNNRNILTIEEHSKVGGLGSLVAESVAEIKKDNIVRVERLGLEDDLSPRNIIAKCEEICGW